MEKSPKTKGSLKTKLKDIEINKKTVTEAISVSSKILKIIYVLVLVLGIYFLTLIVKEWNILGVIGGIFRILSPLFIGLVIAWLLDPIVNKLNKKGMNHTLASMIVFILFVGIIVLIIATMLPMLWNQINDFIEILPNIVKEVLGWLEGLFARISSVKVYDFSTTKQDLFNTIQDLGINLTTKLPDMIVSTIRAILSGLGVTLIGFLIGLFMLLDYKSTSKALLNMLPKPWRTATSEILNEINTSLRSYIQGLFIISAIVFVSTSIAFWIIGLEAPLVFGLICGVTNIIPYIGPYIGGAPAALVGFVQSPATGTLVVTAIFIIQFLEGNILQPIIMGKTMKLHPVVIIIGLLVFGSLFGVLGLILATPIIAVFKVIIVYLDEKYDILKWIDLHR